jgi:hypothetical protein
MRKSAAILLTVILLVGFSQANQVVAQETDLPFQLSLFNPVQVRPEDTSIFLLRVNLIYGKNASVKGLDIGIANHCTGGVSKGLQWGIVGFVEGDFIGWQDHFVNMTGGTFTGLQTGFYNDLDNGEAFQCGFINRARKVSGFQLGFVNYTESMYGLQIGLINFITGKDKLPVLPIVNWSF